MGEGGSHVKLGLQNYSLMLLGPHSRKVRQNITKSVTKYGLFKEKEEENISLTRGKSECSTTLSSLVATTDDQESRSFHCIALKKIIFSKPCTL